MGSRAALGPPRTPPFVWGFGLLGGRFGLARGLLRVAPDHLLDAHRKRAPFLDTDQGQGKEGQSWHRLPIEAGEEPIQAMRTLARFGDDDFIASDQIVRSGGAQIVPEEHPKQDPPRDDGGEKALNRAIAPTFARPTLSA